MEKTIQDAKYIESVDPRDYEKNLAYFSNEQFDVVLTVGAGQREQTMKAAGEYPGRVYLGIDQIYSEDLPNLHSLSFQEDQMGYLAGSIAAMFTETGVVGAVCETSQIDTQWRFCEGYQSGAQTCGDLCPGKKKDEIRVLIRYHDDQSTGKLFKDPGWGEVVAQDMIRHGADVIFGAGGATGQGALLAAAEKGVYAIGAEEDQWYALPEVRPVLITSIYGDARVAVHEWLRVLHAGETEFPNTRGGFVYAPFHDLDLMISDEKRRSFDELSALLQSGAIHTDVPVNAP